MEETLSPATIRRIKPKTIVPVFLILSIRTPVCP
jgi:hypothetical protein